jgi:endoglucanase
MIVFLKKANIIIVALMFYQCVNSSGTDNKSWIRINQLGYAPGFIKTAVLVSKSDISIKAFSIIESNSKKVVFVSDSIRVTGAYGPFKSTFRLTFSSLKTTGKFFISAGEINSPSFNISKNVYDGSADFLLNYLRQQRCGFNPFLEDSCHLDDGYTIYGPMPDGTRINVTGGWHDASDYLQYVATSANATFNLLLAYRDFPFSFNDNYQASGLAGTNGMLDVCDEAIWGLEWLKKMNPEKDQMFNQIADDRDHQGFRLPGDDTVKYGQFTGRPVYFCTGQPQGLFKYKNRSNGLASTSGKFASTFALAGIIFPDKESLYREKSVSAYILGKKYPGVCQTAPARASYFYEEDNWVDDMELAAAELWNLTGEEKYIKDALDFADNENVTPWMGADTARHYQWYPFLNIGHYEAGLNGNTDQRLKLQKYYNEGLNKVWQRAKHNAFFMGVPFIWCSNNLVTALATQCLLYRNLSGDESFIEMEAALRDWLFGCNPWGVSMIIGFPKDGVYAKDPHSSLSHLYNYPLSGGLLDGPVHRSIYDRQKYVKLTKEDQFKEFQSDLAVYHDDVGDYATNEPTMDGSASLVYYLAAMQNKSHRIKESNYPNYSKNHGAIIRGDSTKKHIALVFTGNKYADGAPSIISTLKSYQIKASFFLTGNFYRNKNFTNIIQSLKDNGHYLGAHSDQHLLYCDWQDRNKLLVSKTEFLHDLIQNYLEMQKFGIEREDALYYLPSFEWYNTTINEWTVESGLQLINYSPGTMSHADYTAPALDKGYLSSREIVERIYNYEEKSTSGLNGFILLLHIGVSEERPDKLYDKLGSIIEHLKKRGYQFLRIDQLLEPEVSLP